MGWVRLIGYVGDGNASGVGWTKHIIKTKKKKVAICRVAEVNKGIVK
jgi:hypothetical protein